MKYEPVGSRGTLITFEPGDSPFSCPTSVYSTALRDRLLLCDTHVGPRSMEAILPRLRSACAAELMVFNTHYDFDHVWGNCAFPGAVIMAQSRCYETLASDVEWEAALRAYGHCAAGPVTRCLPNLVFDTRLSFPGDDVELLHTPGHTPDSSSLFDRRDGILFAADNLERPLPYLQTHLLDGYLETLERYRRLEPSAILTSHAGCVDRALIDATGDYVAAVAAGKALSFADDIAADRHGWNLKAVLLSRLESEARAELGAVFDLRAWHDGLAAALDQSLGDLERLAARLIAEWPPASGEPTPR
ncbi:MAG: MBL fold metallo-hydrolase [Candidatus Schekmanbacteria bacterium]|nr:MBL fold metallo-hydrolase [Candidatus Schekmanbacteria bacterium]